MQTNAWVIGAAFSSGMVAVDGVDGCLAASMQRLAVTGHNRASTASRVLGVIVVVFHSVSAALS